MLKFVMLNQGNHSTTTKNYTVTYYKTLEGFLHPPDNETTTCRQEI